jgi:aerotaxis receptor
MAELKLNEESFLVSETDKTGVITFANEDFCQIAGFSLEELVGKPHSIVRHSDMPKAAFADLWKTVQSGQVWTGYVKNACKNKQDYYWVYATVYPTQNGYMSCRRMANRDEIAQAETRYKTLR